MINHDIIRIQDNNSIMCRFYCITFIEYMLAGKYLQDYTTLFSPNDYKKNDKIINRYFKINMLEEASLVFRLRKIDQIRNYLSEELKHNDLMSEQKTKNRSV